MHESHKSKFVTDGNDAIHLNKVGLYNKMTRLKLLQTQTSA